MKSENEMIKKYNQGFDGGENDTDKVEDIKHIINAGGNGYIHPDEIDSGGVQQTLKTVESLDIKTVNPDTGEVVMMCSNEPGNGVHQKGELEKLFDDGISDFGSDDEAKAYVEKMMKKLEREGKQ